MKTMDYVIVGVLALAAAMVIVYLTNRGSLEFLLPPVPGETP